MNHFLLLLIFIAITFSSRAQMTVTASFLQFNLPTGFIMAQSDPDKELWKAGNSDESFYVKWRIERDVAPDYEFDEFCDDLIEMLAEKKLVKRIGHFGQNGVEGRSLQVKYRAHGDADKNGVWYCMFCDSSPDVVIVMVSYSDEYSEKIVTLRESLQMTED